MEELREINFQALIEGQDYEKSLKKIVSILLLILHVRTQIRSRFKQPHVRTRRTLHNLKILFISTGIFVIPLHSLGSSPGD